ncbi:RICIN domain-containing protein [Micromonospora sp. WMMD1076]|uniref:RICIN domain-containing protein n=1 Tax=Micromonospora sp. WMMD1076 TaxID=3016103 RepID=UPI00249B1B4E|nr:RICIN domain-containing protein [Micromonospora sp. WMMD1076]WFF09491.1 RICIN domain-containing protein [Micromonospora sp. WMMD1076]
MRIPVAGAVIASTLTAAILVPATPALAATVQIKNQFPGMCISLSGGSLANNTPAVQWPCSNTADQRWIDITSSGSNAYEIKNASNTNKCLGVAASSTASNAPIVVFDCVSSLDQRWYKIPANTPGYYGYVNAKSGKYMAVSGGSTGSNAKLVIWDKTGGYDQQWKAF